MKNILKNIMGLIPVAVISCCVQASEVTNTINKPNIIIFYVDDLGWQDTTLNDIDEPTPWETPNMMALAKRGMNFTQAYSSAPTCAPSRAGLMSGQHPAKINLTHVGGASIPNPRSKRNQLVAPYINHALSSDTLSLAGALQANGYKTGHVGKWHLGNSASEGPQATGFDFTYAERGAHRGSDDRSKDFDSKKYPLSKEKYLPFSKKNPQGISYPLDLVTENALDFVENNKAQPFFLYLAHWMVHYPIITKNKALLEHYTDKLAIPFPTTPDPIETPGQTNPYYGAMVTTVDWSLGRLVSLLEATDDPRNPGKKLIETTYIFLSSDNGGAEQKGKEIITDNFPLDQGKKHTEEGGLRVPMVVTGPTVAKNVKHHGIVNQLDYYPTILALTDAKIDKKDRDKLSGLDLSAVLIDESKQVTDENGVVRENLFWHFPHNEDSSMRGAIREGDFKLHKFYLDNSYSLYRLYKDGKRFDIEEKTDLAALPEYAEVVSRLSSNLNALLIENNAVFPTLNPKHKSNIAARALTPKIKSNKFSDAERIAEITLAAGNTKLKAAYLLVEVTNPRFSTGVPKRKRMTTSYEKLSVKINHKTLTVSGHVPKESDTYVFVLIDENNFSVISDKYKLP